MDHSYHRLEPASPRRVSVESWRWCRIRAAPAQHGSRKSSKLQTVCLSGVQLVPATAEHLYRCRSNATLVGRPRRHSQVDSQRKVDADEEVDLRPGPHPLVQEHGHWGDSYHSDLHEGRGNNVSDLRLRRMLHAATERQCLQ